MKNLLCLMLALACVFCLFSACGEKTPVEDPSAGTNTPQTPDTHAVPAVEPVARQYASMMIFGDGYAASHCMGDILWHFADCDGVELDIAPITFLNTNSTDTFNMFEMFTFDPEETRVVSPNNGLSSTGRMLTRLEAGDMDYFVVLSGYDRPLVYESASRRTLLAFEYMAQKYFAGNPDGKLYLMEPAGYEDHCTFFSTTLKSKGGVDMPRVQHLAAIKAYAAKMETAAGMTLPRVAIGDAFEYFRENYASSGITLYDAQGRLPSQEGSYYIAAVLYSTLFGKSTVGMDVNGFLTPADAELLRAAAHRFVFGTDPKTVSREISRIPTYTEETPVDEVFADDVYPENFEYLLNTALSYMSRGQLVQYDQLAMDRLNSTFARRTLVNAEPEQASPQRTLYLDCSTFVRYCYVDTFGYDFNGATRSDALCALTENEAFFWSGATSDESAEEAAQTFLETLEPGDVIINSNAKSGHVMMYIGAGKFIHCTGKHKTGGGSDYLYDYACDSRELDGAIWIDSALDLANPLAARYLFTRENSVKILRPMDAGLTPTETAKARYDSLRDTFVYKLTSAPDGITVNCGATVTFTVVITNNGLQARTYTVSDTLPDGLSYASGGNFDGKTVTFTENIAAGATARLEYSVLVDAEAGTIATETYVCGVRITDTPVRVARTLSASEQAKLGSALPDGVDGLDLVKSLYAGAFGFELPIASADELYRTIFYLPYATTAGRMLNGNGTQLEKMLAPGLYGGRNYTSSENDPEPRLKYISADNFITGDILCISAKGGTPEVWVFMGGTEFLTVKNGALLRISGGTSATLLDSLMGQNSFFTLRPSQIF